VNIKRLRSAQAEDRVLHCSGPPRLRAFRSRHVEYRIGALATGSIQSGLPLAQSSPMRLSSPSVPCAASISDSRVWCSACQWRCFSISLTPPLPIPLQLLLAAQPELVTPTLGVAQRMLGQHLRNRRGFPGVRLEDTGRGWLTEAEPHGKEARTLRCASKHTIASGWSGSAAASPALRGQSSASR